LAQTLLKQRTLILFALFSRHYVEGISYTGHRR
jgi:hypothetical protein